MIYLIKSNRTPILPIIVDRLPPHPDPVKEAKFRAWIEATRGKSWFPESTKRAYANLERAGLFGPKPDQHQIPPSLS